jgi:hypothetical protein
MSSNIAPTENEAYAPRPPKGDAAKSEPYLAFREGYLDACDELGAEELHLGSAFIKMLEGLDAM